MATKPAKSFILQKLNVSADQIPVNKDLSFQNAASNAVDIQNAFNCMHKNNPGIETRFRYYNLIPYLIIVETSSVLSMIKSYQLEWSKKS